jgi:putative aldouronate transport system permease protein
VKTVRKRRLLTPDRIAFNIAGYSLLFLFGMICLIPFWLIIMASFTKESVLLGNGYSLFPAAFSLDAYRWIFKNPTNILYAYRNTICATAVGTLCAVYLSAMTGYVLSRKDFSWRNGFSFFFFFTTLFSGGLVPWYILCIRYLGFKNNYLALILPALFSVWNMIIAKNFMKSIPFEITESAKADGANDFLIFIKLILPLSTPLLATIGLFTALTYWNDWFSSMLFMSKQNMQSLQYFLQEMLGDVEALKKLASYGRTTDIAYATIPGVTMQMAMTCVVIGPIILLYPLVQKYFIKGLTIGAVKG